MEEAMRKIADRKIEEAAAAGAFENLPGQGKPIRIDLSDPPEMRLLRQAGALPEWLALDREVRQEREQIESLLRSVQAYQGRRLSNCCAEVLERMRRVNNLILRLNLIRPASVPEQAPFHLVEERERLERLGSPLEETARETKRSPTSNLALADAVKALYAAGRTRIR